MIISTTDIIPNKEIIETSGITKGITIRAKHIGKDIFSGLKSIVREELEAYTALLNEAREQALERMIIDSQRMGVVAHCERKIDNFICNGYGIRNSCLRNSCETNYFKVTMAQSIYNIYQSKNEQSWN